MSDGTHDCGLAGRVSDQPMPTRVAESRDVEPPLIALIRQRTQLGRTRYGTQLQTHNGRDARVDALQEALDLCQYLMQRVLELEDRVTWMSAARASPPDSRLPTRDLAPAPEVRP